MIHQTSVRFSKNVAYDSDYSGLSNEEVNDVSYSISVEQSLPRLYTLPRGSKNRKCETRICFDQFLPYFLRFSFWKHIGIVALF